MLDLPEFSQIKKFKLMVHALLLGSLLTIISLLVNDAISLVLHQRITINLSFVIFMMVFWVLCAAKHKKYQKQ